MMKFIKAALIIYLACMTISLHADEPAKKPMLVVFDSISLPSNEKDAKEKSIPVVCDQRIVKEVAKQITDTNKMDAVIFSVDNPNIIRDLLDKKISQIVIDGFANEENAILIAKALNADYAVRMQGEVSDIVDIKFDLYNLKTEQKFSSTAESEITTTEGPRVEASTKDAVFNASSSMVSQILINIFGQQEVLSMRTGQPIDGQTPASDSKKIRDIQAEVEQHLQLSGEFIKINDIPNAIQELRQTVNLQPKRIDLRMGLAELYLKMDMPEQAISEYKRAILFEKNNSSLYNSLIKLYVDKGDIQEASELLNELTRIEPNNIEAYLSKGDIFWNQSRIADAEKAYLDAEKISNTSPAAKERLYNLYYAKKDYDRAYQYQIENMLLLSTDKNNRYPVISQIIQGEFKRIYNTIQADNSDFARQRISREEYYKSSKESLSHIDSLSRLVDAEKAPEAYIDAHPHAVLAINLLSQACGFLVSYFETEKGHYLEESVIMQNEANIEMGIYKTKMNSVQK